MKTFRRTSKIFLSNSDDDKKVRNPVIQTVNVAIKSSLKQLGLKEIGRNSKYYDPKNFNQNIIESAGMRVWRGFKTSLCIFNKVPYCLIDFSSRVLR
jgi:aubergine-like protein